MFALVSLPAFKQCHIPPKNDWELHLVMILTSLLLFEAKLGEGVRSLQTFE